MSNKLLLVLALSLYLARVLNITVTLSFKALIPVFCLSNLRPGRQAFITDTCFIKTESLIWCTVASFSLPVYHTWKILLQPSHPHSSLVCDSWWLRNLQHCLKLLKQPLVAPKEATSAGYNYFLTKALYIKIRTEKVVPDFFTLWSLIQTLNNFLFSYFFTPILTDFPAFHDSPEVLYLWHCLWCSTMWIPLCLLLRI